MELIALSELVSNETAHHNVFTCLGNHFIDEILDRDVGVFNKRLLQKAGLGKKLF